MRFADLRASRLCQGETELLSLVAKGGLTDLASSADFRGRPRELFFTWTVGIAVQFEDPEVDLSTSGDVRSLSTCWPAKPASAFPRAKVLEVLDLMFELHSYFT